jgi:prophage tail gpP-like protein
LQGGGLVPVQIILTETPYNVIERVAHYAGVLAYEKTDGSMVLSRVGTDTAASGFTQGLNVQMAAVSFTQDERYSVYVPRLFSLDDLQNGVGGQPKFPVVKDPGVKRFRPLVVVSEQINDKGLLVEQMAVWEMNRRVGRSQALQVTVDSWRDAAGKLWEINTFASINIPALKLVDKKWVIATVSYVRDLDRGTVADLVLMPKEAFSVEPTTLVPYDWQVSQALHQGGRAAANPNAPTP